MIHAPEPVLRYRGGDRHHLFLNHGTWFLEPFGLVDVHHSELALPAVEGDFRNVPVFADLENALAAVGLPQDAIFSSVVCRLPFIVWILF